MTGWHEKLATGKDVADTPYKIWDSLLEYGQSKECLAIVDCNEYAEEIIASLRALKPAKELAVNWDSFKGFSGNDEALLHAIGNIVVRLGKTLLCLDHGCDDYPLTFVPSESATRLQELIASFGDELMRVDAFATETA